MWAKLTKNRCRGQSSVVRVVERHEAKRFYFHNKAWIEGALCYMYPINATRLTSLAEEGDVQKTEQLLYKIEALFFLPSPSLPWRKSEPSQRRRKREKKQQQWGGKSSRLRSNNMPITPLVATQTYTITVELNHALPHAAGRATHALQPACELGVLLLDLELRARRLGV